MAYERQTIFIIILERSLALNPSIYRNTLINIPTYLNKYQNHDLPTPTYGKWILFIILLLNLFPIKPFNSKSFH